MRQDEIALRRELAITRLRIARAQNTLASAPRREGEVHRPALGLKLWSTLAVDVLFLAFGPERVSFWLQWTRRNVGAAKTLYAMFNGKKQRGQATDSAA